LEGAQLNAEIISGYVKSQPVKNVPIGFAASSRLSAERAEFGNRAMRSSNYLDRFASSPGGRITGKPDKRFWLLAADIRSSLSPSYSSQRDEPRFRFETVG
jgi:hypothetical protein